MGVLDSVGFAAGLGGLGSVISSGINAWSQQQTNAEMVNLADTAVQRRVADLKAAGLNPVLAAGSAASSPQLAAPRVDNLVPAAMDAASRAQSIAQSQSQADLLASQKALVDSQKTGKDLDNLLAAATLDPNTRLAGAHASLAESNASVAIQTITPRVQEAVNQAGLSGAEWSGAVQDAYRKMNEALASDYAPQLAALGVDQATLRNALSKAQILQTSTETALTGYREENLVQQTAALAYAVQASKMNADALKQLGIAPMFIDAIQNLLGSLARAGASIR